MNTRVVIDASVDTNQMPMPMFDSRQAMPITRNNPGGIRGAAIEKRCPTRSAGSRRT